MKTACNRYINITQCGGVLKTGCKATQREHKKEERSNTGGCACSVEIVVRQKTEHVGATESKVWIGNFNVKARKTIKHILPKTWRTTQVCKISTKRAHNCEKCDVDGKVCVQLKFNHTKCGRERTVTGRPFVFSIFTITRFTCRASPISFRNDARVFTKLFDQVCNFSIVDILLLLLLSKVESLLAINYVSNSFNILWWV